ncbi:hypothetical protein CASFOL_040275 [Castilleja foliolosa]|uniref:Myb-like domain-containing protein n=1 Tax=Castilleja foliolosa TaxID=1961234 RepID=A0ABD3BF05_9LAMI
MATTIVSPSTAAADNIPTATLALPSIPSSSPRLPPPCWSPEETAALIDAYRDKWYSLRRGNLRANHWQEVADDIASHSPAYPSKTAVQCRHKMEKLRKRYRAEIQRATAHGGVSCHVSSWAHFHKMHSMEKGPNPSPPSSSSSEEIEINHKNNNNIKRINDLNYNQGVFPNEVRIQRRPGLMALLSGAKLQQIDKDGGGSRRCSGAVVDDCAGVDDENEGSHRWRKFIK